MLIACVNDLKIVNEIILFLYLHNTNLMIKLIRYFKYVEEHLFW